MFEKVNPSHPDKVADRIAGAIVDMAYEYDDKPKIAVEVLIGHDSCYVIYESSVLIDEEEIREAVRRIAGDGGWYFEIDHVPQDEHLADNQKDGFKCGDNGIFKGVPVTTEQYRLSNQVHDLYSVWPYDGKAILNGMKLTLCQSNADKRGLLKACAGFEATINPLGDWTGGTDVDTGATNRKLGSDMGDAVTGGGLHGKDLSKADVSVNIVCHILAQQEQQEVSAMCSIGDSVVNFEFENDKILTLSYPDVVEMAKKYITDRGGFEKFAEWGLV